jgi:hypothetical protein
LTPKDPDFDWSVSIRANPWQTQFQKKCGRASHPTALLVEFFQLAFPLPKAARRWYWSDSAHKERRFYQVRVADYDSKIAFEQLCGGQEPKPLVEQV